MHVKITASGQGKKSGLFSYSKDSRSINILVIPKVWRQSKEFPKLKANSTTYYEHTVASEIPCLNLLLHETDVVYLKTSDQKWEDILTELAESDEVSETHKDLIAFERKRPKRKRPSGDEKEPTQLPFAKDKKKFNEYLQKLILLALLFQKQSSKSTSNPESEIDDTGGFLKNDDMSFGNPDPFLLLAQHEFVREMKELQDELRQGYISTIERSSVIKGRITNRGIVEHMAFGTPSLECEYDSFTTGLPIYKLLATTLELVANGGVLSVLNLEHLEQTFVETQEGAGQIRHYLGHIPSMPLEQAIYAATHFRVSYQHRRFRKAVALAKKILCMPSSLLENSQEENGLYWSLNTDKIWERCVAQIVDAKHEKLTVETWENISTTDKEIDVVFEVPSCGWIVGDAKYKPVPSTPESKDQHQIFVYSLAYNSHTPVGAALIYPSKDGTAVSIKSSHYRTQTNIEKNQSPFPQQIIQTRFPLHIVKLPFPMPDTLEQWNEKVADYRTTLFTKLRKPQD